MCLHQQADFFSVNSWYEALPSSGMCSPHSAYSVPCPQIARCCWGLDSWWCAAGMQLLPSVDSLHHPAGFLKGLLPPGGDLPGAGQWAPAHHEFRAGTAGAWVPGFCSEPLSSGWHFPVDLVLWQEQIQHWPCLRAQGLMGLTLGSRGQRPTVNE